MNKCPHCGGIDTVKYYSATSQYRCIKCSHVDIVRRDGKYLTVEEAKEQEKKTSDLRHIVLTHEKRTPNPEVEDYIKRPDGTTFRRVSKYNIPWEGPEDATLFDPESNQAMFIAYLYRDRFKNRRRYLRDRHKRMENNTSV